MVNESNLLRFDSQGDALLLSKSQALYVTNKFRKK